MSLIVIALAALTAQPAAQAPAPAGEAAKAPAAATASAKLSTAGTTLAELLAKPAAKAILEKHIPGLTSHPQLERASSKTLRAVMPYSQGMVTAERLDAIDAELAALPAS